MDIAIVYETELEVIETPGAQGPPGGAGLPGPKGDTGPQGPIFEAESLPDFTLIFDNQLI